MLRNWGTLVLMLLSAPILVMAQSTGRIAGTVVDAATGEPLPGANVVIEGTLLGSATDINGEYTIFEVPPGQYTLVASFTGFATERRENVDVIAGITNRQDFQLQESTVELQVVEVTATRPLVNPTATNAVRRLSQEELEALPTRDATTYYAIQPGVTVLNDEVYIRGGRPDETNFLLEGISSRSLVGADNVVPVIPEALEEVQVFAGGYSAELGGANAGIVQQVLRTGGPRLSSLVQYETDAVADGLGTHAYGYRDVTVTLGGPLVWQRHRFFGALNYQNMDNHDPMFWYGADFGQPVDVQNPATPDTAVAALAWEDGILPGVARPREQLKVNGTVLLDFSPLRLRLGYAQLTQDRRINETPIFNMLNQERLPQRDDLSRLGNVQATYFLSDKTYLEGNVGFFEYDFEIYDPLFGSPEANGPSGAVLDLLRLYNRDDIAEAFGSNTALADQYTRYWRGAWVSPTDYVFNGFQFQRPGDLIGVTAGSAVTYQRREQSYYNLGLSLTSQLDNHYLVAGGNYTRWAVRQYQFNGNSLASFIAADSTLYSRIANAQSTTDAALVEVAEILRQSNAGGFGYDEFMNEVDDGPDGPKNPVSTALYVNDRIEFNDIIINAGLRYDFFDMDLWTVRDPANPPFNEDQFTVNGDSLMEAGGKGYLQPRLGLSFPVTNRTAFHLQYGRFAQMPDMFYTYASRPFMAVVLNGQNFISKPFAWELDPIVSTQYEIGLGHQFTDYAAFDVTAFYRKTQGQLEIIKQTVGTGTQANNYNLFINGDFAIARGVEIALRTQRIGGFLGMVNYTLTDAKGTNSEPGGQVAALEQGTAPPSLVQPLSFEERHRGSAILDYRTGETNNVATDNWVVDLLFTFHSGHRFTRSYSSGLGQRAAYEGALLSDTDPRNRQPLEPLNASVTPWFFNTDLRVEKGFDFGPATATVYGYVTNLFNRKNVLNVYLRTGTADNDGFLNTPELSEKIIAGQGDEFVNFYRNINDLNRQHYLADQGYDLFAEPRQVRLGVRVEF